MAEGRGNFTKTWLRSERSHASSHYVVSRRGRIVQLVHQSDIAWHAGNWKINARSVGLEHEGITGDPGGFTRAQYHASARLAAHVARRSLMPIDRRHVIGHDEVPDPVDRGLYGGADNHTDPGRYWRWNGYLKLVRLYAFGRHANAKGPVERVRFWVDGVFQGGATRSPYRLTWNAAPVAAGQHVLLARLIGRDGKKVGVTVTVEIAPAP